MVALERHSLALQTGVSYLLRAYASSSSQINIGKSRDLDRYNIEVICPELTKFWHPTKNGDLRPSDVSVRSVKKFGGSVQRVLIMNGFPLPGNCMICQLTRYWVVHFVGTAWFR